MFRFDNLTPYGGGIGGSAVVARELPGELVASVMGAAIEAVMQSMNHRKIVVGTGWPSPGRPQS
ncbi:MAG: hypothetical protein ACC726_12710 [Chloroflexota bacterium]